MAPTVLGSLGTPIKRLRLPIAYDFNDKYEHKENIFAIRLTW